MTPSPAIPILGSYYVEGRYMGERRGHALAFAQRLADEYARDVDLCRAIRLVDRVSVEPCHIVRPRLKARPELA
jgi:hypothetical protein